MTRFGIDRLAPFVALACVGCGSQPSVVGPFTRDELRPLVEEPPREQEQVRRIGPVQASRGIDDVEALVGAPEPATEKPPQDRTQEALATGAVREAQARTPSPAASGSTQLIDALVGQVNGAPIYASEFFAPMDARLRAEARTMDRNEFLRFAAREIASAIRDKVRDELLLAEFKASLTPQQRQGIVAFVQQLQEGIVAENMGSANLANRRLMETEGMTLEEKIRAERDRELIRVQVQRALVSRVQVSWRDVEREYERNRGSYVPDAMVRLRMIWIDSSDEEKRARVEEALAADEAFEAVAERESDFLPSKGGLFEVSTRGAPYREATLLAQEQLNDAATSLEPGQTTGPIQWEKRLVWMHLEDVEAPEGTSLYDEQLEIFGQLRSERLAEEEQRYFNDLINRSSVSDLETMVLRLLQIAEQRYMRPGS